MAPHSSTLARKIPWMEEPGRLQSMGSLRWTRLSDFTFTFSLSCSGEGNCNTLQCSCLENPRDRGAWWAAVYGVAQSWTQLKRLSSSSRALFKKTGDNKGTFHARMSTIKDRNSKDLTKEEMNKRWPEYSEELYKKRS